MVRFLHDRLWPRLEALSKKAKRAHVAVAFLGRGASKLLHLREGDVLVVDMGDASVKTGRTDPSEILKYLRAGVEVFSVENLHAKAFLFDDTTIVGSSNVSNHSRLDLAEAGIETNDPAVRAEVLRWIDSIALVPVTPKLAAAKAKLYNPPKWGARLSGNKRRSKNSAPLAKVGRLWVVNTTSIEFEAHENQILEKQALRATGMLPKEKKYEIETIRFHGRSRFAREARPGHLVIELRKEGQTIDVRPPQRVVYTRAYKVSGSTRVGVHLECRADRHLYYWREFKTAALKAGVRLRTKSTREIRDPALHGPLLGFFPRKYARF